MRRFLILVLLGGVILAFVGCRKVRAKREFKSIYDEVTVGMTEAEFTQVCLRSDLPMMRSGRRPGDPEGTTTVRIRNPVPLEDGTVEMVTVKLWEGKVVDKRLHKVGER